MDFLAKLRGMYAFSLYNKATGDVIIARDPVGIIPLYYGYSHGHLMIASELKCLDKDCQVINCFPPGHFMRFNLNTLQQYKQGQTIVSYCDHFNWFTQSVPSFK